MIVRQYFTVTANRWTSAASGLAYGRWSSAHLSGQEARRRGSLPSNVNGEEVFIKGSNWVPLDAFHSRDRQRLPQAVALAEELNWQHAPLLGRQCL